MEKKQKANGAAHPTERTSHAGDGLRQRLKPGQVDPHSKLTGETQQAICQAIRDGLSVADAARMAGICRNTAWEWKVRGEAYWDDPVTNADDWRYGDFAQALENAELSIKREMTKRVCQDPDWRSSMAFLKARYKTEFAELQRSEVSGVNGGPIETHSTNPFQIIVEFSEPKQPIDWTVVDHSQQESTQLPIREFSLPGENPHSSDRADLTCAREPVPVGVDLSQSRRNQANARERWDGSHVLSRVGRLK